MKPEKASTTEAVRFHSIPVERLRGAGPKTVARLREKGIRTVEDLLYFCPISYEDRRTISMVGQAQEGKQCNFVGRIVSSGFVYHRSSRKKGFQALFEDASGSISLNWFNFSRPHLRNLVDTPGDFLVSGVVTRFGSQLQVIHPHVAAVGDGGLDDHCRMVPVYSEIQGVGQSIVRKLVREAFRCMESAEFRSPVPIGFEKKHRIVPFHEALTQLHFPDRAVGAEIMGKARRRLILEEFFSFQTALFMKRKQIRVTKRTSYNGGGRCVRMLLQSLPFQLTRAQKRAMAEIEGDMTSGASMNRLLQGDVGCGKTLCAVFAACIAMDNGFQVAFMAPTEILAEQHYLSVKPLLHPMGVSMALLSASAASKRGEILKGLESGEILFVVGTHSLLEEGVRFSGLGLVIIDEQHKFGVLQRKAVIDKASSPNVLAVTATPIPRTLSMVCYGDLDVSVIDEAPPGRRPIKTVIYDDRERAEVYRSVLNEVARGGQAYLVFPVIEEQGEGGLSGVVNQFEWLARGPFQGYTVDMLHGRMPVDEKDEIMKRFREGEIRILVCTTVIEVGLDLPNATIVVIHHAERFGLAQLHQLRGRVGRGTRESVCILLTGQDGTDISRERLRIMAETNDGFRIAEADMMLRGPGEILGLRQSGLPKFRVGDVVEDAATMRQARELTERIIPELTVSELARIREVVIERWGVNLGLVEA
jgi:ATP-dependent DNA helicase RecG